VTSTPFWHFLRDNQHMQYHPFTHVVPGKTYTAEGPLSLCVRGMHASERALDAVCYAPGNVVCRVRLDGEIVRGHDKACARTRTVLWLANAERLLYEFACDAAEQAIIQADLAGQPSDTRSVMAIGARRAWLRGELSEDALERARADAWVASHALRDTIATASADAGRAVAMGPAWLAAGDAARDAAWVAARIVREAATAPSGMPWLADHVSRDMAAMEARTRVWDALAATLDRVLLALAPAEGVPA